jgi:hypothetical protein
MLTACTQADYVHTTCKLVNEFLAERLGCWIRCIAMEHQYYVYTYTI